MRFWALLLGIMTAIGLSVGIYFTQATPLYVATEPVLERGGNADRGRGIFFAGGCASCHATPGQSDPLKLGGGLELKSPYGSFFAPNISPDPDDGIGRWSTTDLVNAMQAGVSPQGEHYFPAFPYTTYAHAKVEDIRDLMAYLRTLEPVRGRAPAHTLKFPFSIRRAVGVWKALYFDRSPINPDPAQTDEWNRGRYLVEALGHCAECHSARDLLGGIESRYRYAGGPDVEGHGWVPNITQHKDGIGDFSKSDIVALLKTGELPEADSVSGAMMAVVRNMAKLSDDDLSAMAEFLKSLSARPSPPKPPK